MRELKFRTWDKEASKMCEGESLASWLLTELNNGVAMGHARMPQEYYWDKDQYLTHLEVMQYTGLPDKNGREIYEGDILDWYGGHMVIAWDTTFAGWQMQTPSGLGSMQFHAGDAEGVKVIGNIHENPGLLEN